MTFKAKTVKTV